MRVYLIRHTAVAVPAGTCYGQTDVALADSWAHDIEQVRAKLPTLAGHSQVYSSPLRRCRRLAEHISPEFIVDDRLQELNFGRWEGLNWDAIPAAEMQAWSNDYGHNRVPGGESYADLLQRSGAFWTELQTQRVDTALVITHGGVILALLAHLLELAPSQIFRLKVDYGSVSAVRLDGEMIRIDYINR